MIWRWQAALSAVVLWALSTFVMIYFPCKATVACADHEVYGVMML
jgi:Fe2+ transport system protein B